MTHNTGTECTIGQTTAFQALPSLAKHAKGVFGEGAHRSVLMTSDTWCVVWNWVNICTALSVCL